MNKQNLVIMPNAIFFYRIERWLYMHNVPVIPKLFQLLIFLLYNTKVSAKAQIGRGSFFICKGVSCVIHDGTVIGEKCRLGIHLTIVGQGPYKKVAHVGNNVWIGPNVTLQGPVKIEDGVVIAPGSVVNKSIPANAIVAGAPARIIGFTTELNYDIMKGEAWDESFRPYLEKNNTR